MEEQKISPQLCVFSNQCYFTLQEHFEYSSKKNGKVILFEIPISYSIGKRDILDSQLCFRYVHTSLLLLCSSIQYPFWLYVPRFLADFSRRRWKVPYVLSSAENFLINIGLVGKYFYVIWSENDTFRSFKSFCCIHVFNRQCCFTLQEHFDYFSKRNWKVIVS